MDNQLAKMVKMLMLWLAKNEIDGDTTFYTIEEWKERKEPYHNDSEFVIATEGGLNFILNYGDPDEFYDLVESFGYYFELGHSWNLGFYKIEEEQVTQVGKSYIQKLKDKRWQNKRYAILQRAKNKFEDCNSTLNLEIHHCYYHYGFEPWEYPIDSLRCLCRNCHNKRGHTEHILRGHLASLKTSELDALINLVSSGLYWYHRKDVFEFISTFKYDQAEMKELFSKILKNRLSQQE
ncbi:GNAT family protein [Cyclobacterium roseum]|uniref:hypothetical protein n=1 Tax=Cyclobacterium roseum TaxID=2666137 RepID=UPI0013910FC5|nr:hypothetical protein [Cyclobacterium roseum]